MSSLSCPSSLDWPLSRAEKKQRILQCYENATRHLLNSSCIGTGTLASRPGVGQPCSEPELPGTEIPASAVAKTTADGPGLDLEVWRQAVEAAILIVSDSTSCADAKNSAAAALVTPSRARYEYAQLHDSMCRASLGPGHCSLELEFPKGHRGCTSRARCSSLSPAPRPRSHAIRDVRGAPRVSFSGNGLDQSREWVSAGAVAGRHRLSRGPDGALVRIHAYRLNSDSESEVSTTDTYYSDPVGPQAATGSFVKASIMAGAVAGGTGGMMTGGAMGAAIGLGGVLFTLGLSVPIGAVIGGSTGLFAGSALGGAVGYVTSTGRVEVGWPRHFQS